MSKATRKKTKGSRSRLSATMLGILDAPNMPGAMRDDLLERLRGAACADGISTETVSHPPEAWLPDWEDTSRFKRSAFLEGLEAWSPYCLGRWLSRYALFGRKKLLVKISKTNALAAWQEKDWAPARAWKLASKGAREDLTDEATDVYRRAVEKARTLAGNLRKLGLRPPDIPFAGDPLVGLELFGEWCARCPSPGTKAARRKRRRKADRSPRPLTERQLEALQLWAEHKGNYAATARSMGIDYSTLREHVTVALRKLGKTSKAYLATAAKNPQSLPQGPRGEALLTEEDQDRGR